MKNSYLSVLAIFGFWHVNRKKLQFAVFFVDKFWIFENFFDMPVGLLYARMVDCLDKQVLMTCISCVILFNNNGNMESPVNSKNLSPLTEKETRKIAENGNEAEIRKSTAEIGIMIPVYVTIFCSVSAVSVLMCKLQLNRCSGLTN